MKYQIEEDEAYPVYSIWERDTGIEIPEDKVKWIIECLKNYDEAQDYLQKLYEEMNG